VSHVTWVLLGDGPPICLQVDSELRMRRRGPDKEPLPDATPVFAVGVAVDFEAADEMVTGSLWMSTLTVTSWSRSAFIRPTTDCPSRHNLPSSR
jgi:hypothetical protein